MRSSVQEFGELGSLVVRLWKGRRHVEVEWTAGPILSSGKEIVLWYKTDVPSGETFFTDANGRELQPRRRNYSPTWHLNVTEPVAGNFYPVTAAIYIGVSPSFLTHVLHVLEAGRDPEECRKRGKQIGRAIAFAREVVHKERNLHNSAFV